MKRVLLDTNVLIHREAERIDHQEIGTLFRALDQIQAQKCVHPSSITEIEKHANADVVKAFKVKLNSYHILKTLAPTTLLPAIAATDKTENDRIDTAMLREVAAGRVDYLLTEDRGIHHKARQTGLNTAVFTIDSFLEKVNAENPAPVDYKVLSVRKTLFGNVNLQDTFFDSFRADYPKFDQWYNKKSDETCYVCTETDGRVLAFLFLKREGKDENYGDITPPFKPATRLKIGTFKVAANGYKLGERFLKIVFDNAVKAGVDEIYVTAFDHTQELERLLHLLEEWGFVHHGTKKTDAGTELVLVRNFKPAFDAADARRTYPYVSSKTRQFIVPIYPEYHTELLPDSILKTEDAAEFEDNKSNRNAVSKVYVSRSINRDLRPGDVLVFYRTASGGSARYTSVATTLGIVQEIIDGFVSKADFIKACRKRSVFADAELAKHWDWSSSKPFIVNFLYAYSLPKRPNLENLQSAGIIVNAPRGFEPLTPVAFRKLLEISNADHRLVFD